MKKITWAKFIEIINSGVIIRNDYGVCDTIIDDSEEVVEFHFDIDGEDGEIILNESDNATLVYQGNTLYFNDSEGDVDEISVSQTIPFSFDAPKKTAIEICREVAAYGQPLEAGANAVLLRLITQSDDPT